MTKTRTGLIAALDVGTAKVCCFIAEEEGAGVLRVIGIGHQLSRGLRNGAVIDMDAAETAIRAAVHAAENMAGETVRGVVLGLSGGQPASQWVNVEMVVGGHAIGNADVKRVMEEGCGVTASAQNERTVIHSLPVGYTIDGVNGVRDPRGMFGDRLGAKIHVVTAARGPVRNLKSCVARCHLEVDAMVLPAYGSGLATAVEDEINLGVICIDMGAGTTAFSVFHDGEMIHADTIPVGGAHVTNDIARGLAAPLVEAERLKSLYGSVIATPEDRKEMIDVPQVGEADHASPNYVPRAVLVDIIRPRLEETFELVRARLNAAGLERLGGRRAVLTGGASQLSGVRELAAQILDKQVRLGRPGEIRGLAESMRGPAFATCAGLLVYALNRSAPASTRDRVLVREPGGRFGRMGQWLKENF